MQICEVEKTNTISHCFFKENKGDIELIFFTYVKVITVTFSVLNRLKGREEGKEEGREEGRKEGR